MEKFSYVSPIGAAGLYFRATAADFQREGEEREATTSMQRDVMDGKASEIDGLVYEVVRMGEKYHVPVPVYAKVAEKLKEVIA